MERREEAAGAIIDSAMTREEALAGPCELTPSQEILDSQDLLDVYYHSFDGMLHKGQIVVAKDIARDVAELFDLIKKSRFPIKSVIPIGDLRFMNDDDRSAYANNSSGFNYRTIAKTNRLSNHSFGRAIDLNPYLNPYIREDYRQPEGVEYDPSLPGAITADGEIVKFLKSRGWEWGGDWVDRKDYMHFEAPKPREIIPPQFGDAFASEIREKSKRVERKREVDYVPGFENYAIYSSKLEKETPILLRQSWGPDAPNQSDIHVDTASSETPDGNRANADNFIRSQGFNGVHRVQILGKFASEMYDFKKAKDNPKAVLLDTHTDYQIVEVSSLDFGNKDHDDPANIIVNESDPNYSTNNILKVEANFVFTRDPNVILTIKPADCPIVVGYCKDKDGNDLMFVDHSGRDAANSGLTYQGLLYLRDVIGVDISTVKVAVLPGVSKENYFITNQPERRGWGISEESWGENIEPKYSEQMVEGLLKVHPKYKQDLSENQKDLLREQISNGQLRNVDIPEATIVQLLKAGVLPENIHAILVDSYTEAEKGNAYSQRFTNESGGKRKGRSMVAAQLQDVA